MFARNFVSYLRRRFLLEVTRFMSVLSSKSFMIVGLTFKSLIFLEPISMRCEEGVRFHSFA